MMLADSMVKDGRSLHDAGGGIASAIAGDDQDSSYDRHAALYDRVIANGLYNRLAWGARPRDYHEFAREAVGSGDGPFLDAGCGTLVFTADAYRESGRPLVLVDRSLAMLEQAAGRIGRDHAKLVRADLMDLPFAHEAFETVACFGTLHVLDHPWGALAALNERVAPGGSLYISMLTTDRGLSRAYLRALHRRGEVGRPRDAADLARAAREVTESAVEVERRGAMAFLRITRPGSTR